MPKEPEIRLSPKYNLNPAVSLCFYCNEPGELILLGHLSYVKAVNMFGEEIAKKCHGTRDDLEAPKGVCFSQRPCATCAKHMEEGVIFISVKDDDDVDKDNPYRTGNVVVLKEEAVKRIVKTKDILDDVLKKRVAFIPDKVWDLLGLPKGEVPATP